VRTTIELADDVLFAVKDRARRERRSLGAVLSDLARQALTQPVGGEGVAETPALYGFEALPRRGPAVSNELIDRLREDDGE
jgi:hypothetical protein